MNKIMGTLAVLLIPFWSMANPIAVESALPLNPSGLGEIGVEYDYYWVKYVTAGTTTPEYTQSYMPARLTARYTILPELEIFAKGSWVLDRRVKVTGYTEVVANGLGSTILGWKSVMLNAPSGPQLALAFSAEFPTGNARGLLPTSEGTNFSIHVLSTFGFLQPGGKWHASVGYKRVGSFVDVANNTIQRGSLGLWGMGVEWPLPELATGLRGTLDTYGMWVMANTASNGSSANDYSQNTYSVAVAPGLQWQVSDVRIKIGTAWNVLYNLPGVYGYDLDWRWRHSLSVSYLFGTK